MKVSPYARDCLLDSICPAHTQNWATYPIDNWTEVQTGSVPGKLVHAAIKSPPYSLSNLLREQVAWKPCNVVKQLMSEECGQIGKGCLGGRREAGCPLHTQRKFSFFTTFME